MALSTRFPFWAEPRSGRTRLYLRKALVENFKSHLKTLAKGYLFSIVHPWDCLEKTIAYRKFLPSYSPHRSCTGLQQETESMQLNSVPGFAETASTTRSTATHSFTLCKTRISVLLRFARGKFTVPLFSAASKQNCIWKRRGKITFCTPKSLSRLCFSIPMRACCCRVVGALVGSSQVWALWLQHGDSFAKGYAAMPSVSPNLKRKTAASRGGNFRRVPLCIIQTSSEQHSQTSSSLNHPKIVLIL